MSRATGFCAVLSRAIESRAVVSRAAVPRAVVSRSLRPTNPLSDTLIVHERQAPLTTYAASNIRLASRKHDAADVPHFPMHFALHLWPDPYNILR